MSFTSGWLVLGHSSNDNKGLPSVNVTGIDVSELTSAYPDVSAMWRKFPSRMTCSTSVAYERREGRILIIRSVFRQTTSVDHDSSCTIR